MIQESFAISGVRQLFHPLVPEVSYLIGLLQTDGHLSAETRDRGKMRLEMQAGDRELLEQLQTVIPFYSSISERVRDTNFKTDSASCILSVYDQGFRELMNYWGIPYGRKSEIVCPPSVPFSAIDYVRGLIDGNGSVAFASSGRPLISLTVTSDLMADYYLDYLAETTHKPKKQVKRNARDNVYNIVVTNEDAVTLAKTLYYDGCLALERKRKVAEEVKKWIRPSSMRRAYTKKGWNKEEDAYILTHSIEESVTHLGRTKHSVQMRLWRLRRSA